MFINYRSELLLYLIIIIIFFFFLQTFPGLSFRCQQHIPHALLFSFLPSLPLIPSFLLWKMLNFLLAPSSIHLIFLRAGLARLEHKQSNRAADSIYRCAANSPIQEPAAACPSLANNRASTEMCGGKMERKREG